MWNNALIDPGTDNAGAHAVSAWGFSLEPAEEWKTRAVCAQTDPEAFFPEKGGSTRDAKRICNGGPNNDPCPVKNQCLQSALEHDEGFGIWGGLSERERRRLKAGDLSVLDKRGIERECRGCGGTFTIPDRRSEPDYCSRACRTAAQQQRRAQLDQQEVSA